MTLRGCGSSPGWPQYVWGVFIRPNNRMHAIRVIRVVAQVQGTTISIKEAADMFDSWPVRPSDGFVGPVSGEYTQHTPAYVVYDLYRHFNMEAIIEERGI